jgi:hypothetical protein
MKKMRKLGALMVLAFAALPVITAAAQNAQTVWEQQVRSQLYDTAADLRRLGMSSTHEIFVGELRQGRTQDVTYNFTRNTRHVIIGMCDADCGDLDLKLYDSSGNLVDEDLLADDYPKVEVTPRWSGKFTLRAIMAECSVEPCKWGAQAYK